MKWLALLTCAGLAGCAAVRASGADTIPPKNVEQCRTLCASADMELTSLVIVANQTGCVCQHASAGASAAATGGAVAVMLAERQRQEQAAAEQRSRQRQAATHAGTAR